jgi:hypothetical protein
MYALFCYIWSTNYAYTMKFEIFQSENNGKFYFRLKARNGQIILSSQGYSTKASARNGIESVQRHAEENLLYDRKETSNGKYHFSLKARNGQVVGSSQLYATRLSLEKGIEAVKRAAQHAVLLDLTKQ